MNRVLDAWLRVHKFCVGREIPALHRDLETIRAALERQRVPETEYPDLQIEDKNGNPMSRYLREQYTSAKPVVVAGEPDARTVWLDVRQQHFQVGIPTENEEEAEWVRDMLAIALTNIVLAAAPEPDADLPRNRR